MDYKVHFQTLSRDLYNAIDKTDKKSFYLLFSRKSNRRRREFRGTITNNMLKKDICRDQEPGFHLQ